MISVTIKSSKMNTQPNFNINPTGKISQAFLQRNVFTFKQASEYVKQLPYGRNANKEDLAGIFIDNCGTCSTRHALLKQLAGENNFEGLNLVLGLFKMNAVNTPKISSTLQKYQLAYIPEAHNYLRFDGQIIDCTTANSKPEDFINDLIEEIVIEPEQITGFKVAYHKNYLKQWLLSNTSVMYSLEELWNIREQCIQDLSANDCFSDLRMED